MQSYKCERALMTRRQWLGASATSVALLLSCRVMAANADTSLRDIAPWTLYAFDNGLNGPDVPTIAAKVSLLKKLGYAGMTDHFNANRLPQVLEELDKQGLEFASLYYTPRVEDDIDSRLRDAIVLLNGRRARIEIGFTSKQFKPSDPAADARASDLLKRATDWCAETGPVISIYPHRGFWTERTEDGVRLARKVGRSTLGVNLNLVHWKWVPQSLTLEALLAEALPHLKLVTINGVDGKNKDAIVSLADGDFDVTGWLRTIQQAGYNGPIGLQCYSLKGSSEAHLSRSMDQWREIRKQLSRPARCRSCR